MAREVGHLFIKLKELLKLTPNNQSNNLRTMNIATKNIRNEERANKTLVKRNILNII